MRRIDRRNPDGKDGEKLSNGEDVVKLFLSHDRDFWATESILVATVERLPSCGTETLQLLLQRDSGAGVKEAVVESVKDPENHEVATQASSHMSNHTRGDLQFLEEI